MAFAWLFFLTNFSLFYGFYISILDCKWHRWINIAARWGEDEPFSAACYTPWEHDSNECLLAFTRDLASGICPKETEMLFRNDDMYISFWLNRYQTNKYNAARRKNFTWFITFWKPTHLFFIPFSNYIIQLGAGEEKIVPSMEQEINHFGAIKKIGYVFHFFFCKSM